jgi:hypothetical protein
MTGTDNPKVFEIEFDGKTYTTQKLTPILRGRATRTLAYIQKEMAGYSQEEAQTLEWLQAAVAGAVFEHIPGLMWDFLQPQDKTTAGTRDAFIDRLEAEQISGFFQWVSQALRENADFFGGKPAETDPPSQPEASTPTSAEATTAGPMTTAPA